MSLRSLSFIVYCFLTFILTPFLSSAQCTWDPYPGNVELRNEIRNLSFENVGVLNFAQDFSVYRSGNLEFDLEFASALWMSAYDPNGNLKVAANTYPNSSSHDYDSGPIIYNGTQTQEFCDFYNRVWKVTANQVRNLINNFNNGQLDQSNIPIDILEWPANGNINLGEFVTYSPNGMAPFYDHDSDGLYDVMNGDYPLAVGNAPEMKPSQFVFKIYNDRTVHVNSQGEALDVEIHQMDYTFDCLNDLKVEHAIFTHVTFINKGVETLLDFRVGVWEDKGLDCNIDDYAGCNLNLNCTFTYNKDGIDSEGPFCIPTVQNPVNNPAINSKIYFDKEMKGFICNSESGLTAIDPYYLGFHNMLSGFWITGSDLTYGGTGFNPGSADVTRFAFPDSPLDSMGWSMQMENLNIPDVRTLTTVIETDLLPLESITLEFADHLYYDPNGQGLEIFEDWENAVEDFKDEYQMLRNGTESCVEDLTSFKEPIVKTTALHVWPNPAIDNISVRISEKVHGELKLFSADGKVIRHLFLDNADLLQLSTAFYPKGIYFLRIETHSGINLNQKFVKI